MILTPYFSRVRAAVSEARIKESIQEEMHEIKDRWGDKLTEGGEPQVLLNTKTNEVWISTGDWHESELQREIFEELEELAGVTSVDGESESYPSGYNYGRSDSDWERVYPKG